MRVLLTGCCGFIGAKVSEAMIRRGHTVLGIDNLNDAYDVRLKEWRLAHLRSMPGFVYVRHDITDLPGMTELVRRRPVDAVVNLAARAGVRQSVLNPRLYYETNLTGTLNLLELCREREIPKFVLASTSSLYARGPRPFQEDQPTDRPLSPYASSKKAAETLCYASHSLSGLDVTILRYFTVYGPAGRPDMSIFRFIRWIAEEEPVTVFGDGSQERDFTFVDDVAEASVAALKPLGYEVINIGSDRPVRLMDIIRILEDLLGRPARLAHRPPHPADVPATWADISKARAFLDWTPRTSLQAGLEASVRWYRNNRAWASSIDLCE